MGRCGHRPLQTRNDKEVFGLQYGQAGKTMVQCTSSWGSVPAGGYGMKGKLIVFEGTDGSGKAKAMNKPLAKPAPHATPFDA